jgi:transposase-like protein
MIKDNLYQDEALEAGVRAIVSRFLIREDECPYCKTEANFVKMVDCEDYWRCMSCLKAVERKFTTVEGNTLPEIHVNRNKFDDGSFEIDDWDIRAAKNKIIAQKRAEKELAEEEKKFKENSE